MEASRVAVPSASPLLTELGLASTKGIPSLQGRRKLAQIEGMLPWLLAALEDRGPVSPRVVEFGCGKGYVSFFLAQALRALGRAPVPVVGVDRNPSLIARCRSLRDVLGWPELEFAVQSCEEFASAQPPALVTALHACSIATDHALAAGIRLGAAHIVVAPCCYSVTQHALREAGHRHEFGYLARSFPVLGARLSNVLTDGLRCLSLRAHGYEVKVREFVSGTATPMNVLLIARRAGLRGDRARAELQQLEARLGLRCEVEVSLARRLRAG